MSGFVSNVAAPMVTCALAITFISAVGVHVPFLEGWMDAGSHAGHDHGGMFDSGAHDHSGHAHSYAEGFNESVSADASAEVAGSDIANCPVEDLHIEMDGTPHCGVH